MNTRNLVFCFLLTASIGPVAAADVPLKFDEVYQLLRTNLEGSSPVDLDRAAVKGLIQQFPGQVMLYEPSSVVPSSVAGPLDKAALYDDSYAYFHIDKVEGPLAEKLRAAFQDLAQTNKSKIKGVILDLRFAEGTDYAVAAATADCFLNSDQPLLDWGSGSASATKKANAITLPLAILVNSQTTGAAEALVAALRESNIGLVLGGTTAGQANIFKEFSLGNGEKLRIATARIKLGDGTTLAHGLKPDIAVETSLADERAYLEDPYKELHPLATATNEPALTAHLSLTNQPVQRSINEAELVREKRAGETPDGSSDDTADESAVEQPPRPVIADTVLARALDLLKGIAVIQQSHPG